ncbi:MAG TPA: cupin domain-containing protein [Acidimicrobiia bacterium]|nr:cupin domain-containing protein [Acidimicrobiia bacterium]
MDHTPAERLQWNRNPATTFTGTVWSSPLSRDSDRSLTALAVMFEPGARTYWHSHPEGQVLYVTSGAGRVGTANGDVVEISPGDVVFAPPGEMHWHGASPTSYMMHLSLTTGGATVWDTRPVSDDAYESGPEGG